jgi:phage gpG-like protein
MAGFTLDMSQLEKFLEGMQERIQNPSPLMQDIGELWVSSTKKRIARGADPEGTKQPAVARGGVPLVDSGDYLASITYAAGISDITIGTNKEQAALLQFGGEVKPKSGKALVFTPKGAKKPIMVKKVKVKPRPHLGISKEDKEEIAATIGDYLGG